MFLTIVTRCCQRPLALRRNIESVITQSCHDVEQIFIVDHKRKGIHLADRMLGMSKDRVEGEYVYILDDDCYLINDNFISTVNDIAFFSDPDIIMVKSRRPPGPPSRQAIVPIPSVWGGKLRHGSCNCLCYVMRAELWKEHIIHFGDKPWGGDWWMLEKALATDPDIYWHDEIMADAVQLGRGRRFETKAHDWFAPIAEDYYLTNLGEEGKEDWRLQLWTRDWHQLYHD
jgi:hypothetical protein